MVEVVPTVEDASGWQPLVGEATHCLREYFVADDILPSEQDSERVVAEAARVLSQCVPPAAPDSSSIGLVCGYVQSGKTASMTAVSALARDNGYRVIILIAGTTTNLVEQNRQRMEEHLRAATPKWTWTMLSNPRAMDRPDVERLLQEWRSPQYEEADRRTLFISVMKNHRHLASLATLLEAVDLRGIPGIIFDDEADQASLNTRPNAPSASSTYSRIATVRRALPHHTYLQYTATPQAPLLITRIDSLSPDFAELVSPGEGYIGGHEFFAGANRAHVRPIPTSDIHRDGHLPLDPPPSLLRALQAFFVGVAAGRLAKSRGNRSMLVHPSKATATHRQYYEWANQLRDSWHRVLLLPAADPDRTELIGEFGAAHADLTRTCKTLPPFESLQTRLPIAINQTAVTLVNSVDGSEVPWPNSYSHVLVGGEKLGRGYTVKGLTVTYMPRSAGGWTADTIQQRARFFGYHSQYAPYCRVFLHPDVANIYITYVTHEEDMRARLAEHRGQPLREWRRLFYLDRRLAPTRRNVLHSPYFRPRFNEGWFAPRAPHLAPIDANRMSTSRLDALDFQQVDGWPHHQRAIGYLGEVFEQVLVPFAYLDEKDSLGLCVVNCNLRTLLEQDPDAQCTVYRMDTGRARRRTLQGRFLRQLFQGRSSAGSQSYPGDRAFFDTSTTTLQIHTLRVEGENDAFENVPAIAVRLVRQEDVLVHEDPHG